jgi:peptidoglycan/LPS O-acetylase OafA/YrhL
MAFWSNLNKLLLDVIRKPFAPATTASPVARSEQGDDRIVGIELLRFASAVAVLVFHYQHFAFVGYAPANFVREAQPFFRPLQLFYENGHYGVEVFWCISGFIFFWKYGRTIAERRISGRAFLVLRVSRLYPLHLLTLLFVAALQPLYAARIHAYFVYHYNDLYHFVLQLFMASNWVLQAESFNGPIWSISVEVLVYGIFFLVLRLGSASWVTLGAMLLGSGLIQLLRLSSNPVFTCLWFFFLGCAAALAFIATRRSARLAGIASAGAILAVIAVLVLSLYIPLKPKWLLSVLSPAVIFLAVSHVRATPVSNRLLVPAGNMTYSSYLLHVPLQLTVVTYCAYTGLQIPFYSPYFFVGFIVIILALSSLCHKYFEMPAQRMIRRRFMPRAPAVARSPA